MVDAVEQFIEAHSDMRNVESIQDQVEKTLMQNGFYDEAKSYILFRFQRTERRNAINSIVADAEDEGLKPILKKISSDYISVEYSLLLLSDKFKSFCKDDMKQADKIVSVGESGSRNDHSRGSQLGVYSSTSIVLQAQSQHCSF